MGSGSTILLKYIWNCILISLITFYYSSILAEDAFITEDDPSQFAIKIFTAMKESPAQAQESNQQLIKQVIAKVLIDPIFSFKKNTFNTRFTMILERDNVPLDFHVSEFKSPVETALKFIDLQNKPQTKNLEIILKLMEKANYFPYAATVQVLFQLYAEVPSEDEGAKPILLKHSGDSWIRMALTKTPWIILKPYTHSKKRPKPSLRDFYTHRAFGIEPIGMLFPENGTVGDLQERYGRLRFMWHDLYHAHSVINSALGKTHFELYRISTFDDLKNHIAKTKSGLEAYAGKIESLPKKQGELAEWVAFSLFHEKTPGCFLPPPGKEASSGIVHPFNPNLFLEMRQYCSKEEIVNVVYEDQFRLFKKHPFSRKDIEDGLANLTQIATQVGERFPRPDPKWLQCQLNNW